MNNILKISLIILALSFTTGTALATGAPSQSLSAVERHAITTLFNKQEDTRHITILYRDLDEDGVPDRQDHCLNSAFGFPVNTLGCELDGDGDGVFDRSDRCPHTIKNIAVNFLGCEGDQDRDKVLDSTDQCPNTPLGAKVNHIGCQVEQDSDRDGVVNSLDLCPETPLGTAVNDRGCKEEVFLIANIVFSTGSYAIRADQRHILDDAMTRLKDKAANEVIVITGHTDSVGTEIRNRQLSWNRAQSVKEYFVEEYNYNPEQIFVLGRGELEAIDSNKTPEGRQNNRRITFQVLNIDDLHPDVRQDIPEEMKGYDRYGYRN